jgi:tetratricopeptide (TPR) repeat protein
MVYRIIKLGDKMDFMDRKGVMAMARNIIVAVLAVVVIGVFNGCANPKVDDAHLQLTEQEQQSVAKGALAPDAGEVDVVEQVASTRSAYQTALEELIAYYNSTGNETKRRWATNELTTLKQMAQYRYLMPGELVTQNMSATVKVEDADVLYKKALGLYIDAGGYFIITNNAKLRQSLQLFNQLMTSYPNSTRIDEAAYRAGQIYEHFKDYELAAVMYQRCFQWNDKTSFPARYRAAYVLDQKLKMRKEALALYKLSVQKESRYEDNTKYSQSRIYELSVPDTQLEKEAQGVLQK